MKIVVSSHSFYDIRLHGMRRVREIDSQNNVPIKTYNTLGAYALRLLPQNWVGTTLTEEILISLPLMTWQQFASKFHVYITGKISIS